MRKTLGITALACTLGSAHTADWQTAQLPVAQESNLTSAHTGHTYRIQTTAIGTLPKKGYPVLYLLDGDNYFAHAALLAHTLLQPPGTQTSPALIIVGIGYPNGKLLDLDKRARDYTPPPQSPDGKHGGAAQFARFMHEELLPHLHAQYRINPEEQNIFGHSYGGLFALYHLHGDTPLRRYYLSSPSIWWENRRILQEAATWRGNPHTHSIRISVGSLEQGSADDEKRRARAMVDNARALGEQLQAHHADTQFSLLDGETHGSAAFQAIHRMMQHLAANLPRE